MVSDADVMSPTFHRRKRFIKLIYFFQQFHRSSQFADKLIAKQLISLFHREILRILRKCIIAVGHLKDVLASQMSHVIECIGPRIESAISCKFYGGPSFSHGPTFQLKQRISQIHKFRLPSFTCYVQPVWSNSNGLTLSSSKFITNVPVSLKLIDSSVCRTSDGPLVTSCAKSAKVSKKGMALWVKGW